jgi:hypothetical protein
MEATSLALAVLPLFTICLDYFQYFKTANSLLLDYQLLLLKFDFEHERFLIWGEQHGVNKVQGEGRNPKLDEPSNVSRITKALELLKALFESKDSLETKYGLIAMPSDSQTAKPETQGKFITSAALKRFWTLKSSPGSRISAKAASGSTTHRVLAKTQWAIQDKDKFAALVNHVRDLVTGLYDVLPIPLGHEDKLVTEDIRSLLPDTRRLRQVEIASKDVYPAWSEAASVVASISEMGSIALGTQQGEVGPAGTESLVEVASNAMQIPQDELGIHHDLPNWFEIPLM